MNGMSGLPKPNPIDPRRGEIWDVRFEPSVGAEQKKTRPAVVVSPPSIGRLPLRIVVPITEWKVHYERAPWFVPIPPLLLREAALTKESGADAFQVKSVSLERFVRQLGRLGPELIQEISDAVALCVGFSIRRP